jgi:VanZ family protein
MQLPANQLTKRFWRYGPLLFWLLVIFFASTNHFSKDNTTKTIGPFLQWAFSNFSEQTIDFIIILIRKSGHFIGYALLAFLAARALISSTKPWVHLNWFYWSLFIIIIYSITDEYHQSFEITRSASLQDCLIDIAGGLTYLIIYSLIRNKKLKKESIKNG